MNRKSIIFLATLTVLGIASCSSEDEKKINHPIIGTWTLTHTTIAGCTDSENDYSEPEECGEQFCQKIQYKSDGTLIFTEIYEGVTDTEGAKFTIANNTVLACETTNDCGDLQTFTIVDNTLTLVSQNSGNGCTTTEVWVKE